MGTESKSDLAGRFGEMGTFGDSFEKGHMLDALRGRMFSAPTDRTMIDRFRVLERLGAGAHGVVFAAEDPRLERRVAIKLLRRERSLGSDVDGCARARLLREAKTLAKLRHRNVVSVHEVGEHEGRVFLAMELVEGQTLSKWIAEGPHRTEEVVRIFLAAGEGLAAAHAAGLVHRDFKPANVLIDDAGQVRVVDFGLARAAGSNETTRSDVSTGEQSEEPHLTATGALVGTPAYMAPELLAGAGATALSDQYAFCLALDEAFYGTRRYSGRNVTELATNIALGKTASRPAAAVPRHVRRVIERGLSVNPRQRFDSMEQLLAQLHRPRNMPLWLPLGAGGIALSLGGAAWIDAQHQRDIDPCAGVDDALASTWNAKTRAAMKVAFERSGVVAPEERFASVAREIDGFAEHWAALADETCTLEYAETPPLGLVLTRRKTCLEGARVGFETAIEVLLDPTAELLASDEDMLPGRRRLATCNQDDILLTALGPPPTPAQRAAVSELERELQRAHAKRVGDELDEALTLYVAAVERADAVGYEPTRARAWLGLGMTHKLMRDSEAELDSYRQALLSAERGADDLVRIRTLRLIARRMAAELKFDVARQKLDESAAVLQRVGIEDGVYQAEQALAEAGLADREGRTADALVLFRRAVEELPADYRDAQPYLTGMMGIADALRELGEYQRSLETFQTVLAFAEEHYGPSSEFTATVLMNSATSAMELEQLELAAEYLERAYAIRALRVGPGHRSMSVLLINRSALEFNRRNYEGALALALEALRAVSGDPGQKANAITVRKNIGTILSRMGRYDEAVEMLQAALAARKEAFGGDVVAVARAEASVAMTLILAERADEALDHLERALPVFEKELGPSSESVHWCLSGLGEAHFLLERHARADALLARAETLERGDVVGDEQRCQRGFASARVARARGEAARGRTQAERALSACRRAHLDGRVELIERWLKTAGPRDR